MISAVIHGSFYINNRIAGINALFHCIDDAFLDGGDVLPRNPAADDLVVELETGPGTERLNLNDYVRILPLAAGLLDELAALPVLDDRKSDEILGYNKNGSL